MSTLPLATVELVSVQSAVPENGSPSSHDYNDDQNNALVDLASIASFLNGTLIPLIQVLPTLAAAAGLEGRAVNTDSTDTSPLSFNALTSTPLTVSQSLRYLLNLIGGMQGQVTDLTAEVDALASQLSSTNQNDIALTLQNFQSTLNTMSAAITALQLAGAGSAPSLQQTAVDAIEPLGTELINVAWSTALSNDAYTVVCSVEDSTGYLQVESWAYVPGGANISVRIRNTDAAAAHSGTIHAVAYGS